MDQVNHASKNKHWHFAKWPFLAWLETFIKLLALAIGIFALIISVNSNAQLASPAGIKLVQLAIQTVLSLGLIAAIFDRLQEREIIAMIFVILNNLGHIGILCAVSNIVFPTSLLMGFWILMLLGDGTKLFFLRIHHFSVRNASPAAMYGLTSFYIIGYAALIVLQLLG